MIRIGYACFDAEVIFTTEGGSVDHWARGDAGRCDAIGSLRTYGEGRPGSVRFESSRVVASHAAVAMLGVAQAHSLGLPGRPPFVLSTDTSGVIGSPRFKLTARWLDGARPVVSRRQGAFLETEKGRFLIPEPLFSAIELAAGFDAGAVELSEHWAALARFRNLLDPEVTSSDPAEMSGFLRGLRIYTGAALSLALSGTNDDVHFDPILFDVDTARRAVDDGRPLVESDGMLPAEVLRTFQQDARTGFRAFDAAKRSYLLGRNTYLVVDDDVEAALQVVREKQQAGSAERRAFAANPRAAIIERLAEKAKMGGAEAEEDEDAREEELEARAAALFVETPEYADRAIGIGLWQTPQLDFLPHTPNIWLPEIFAIDLGGVWVRVDQEAVAELRQAVDAAIEAGMPEVDYKGQRIPATADVRSKLAGAVGTERPRTGPNEAHGDGLDDKGGEEGHLPRTPHTVVLVHENFVEENWSPSHERRGDRRAPVEVPGIVTTNLLDHQWKALKWQIEAWRVGHLGVLNADDQGLGKTLQTLAFIAWLQDRMDEGPSEKRRPALVVAPTGLLRTWETEASEHLSGVGLGARINAYGSALRSLRMPGLSGKDTDDGEPRLSFRNLRRAIENGNGHRWWVLTTYETLANYQHSFRQIDFSVAVFDEIQKIKNVRTLIALAARAVKADFRIALTGTPIENHVGDLWAIMDAIAPGRLGTLSSYLDRYRVVTEEGMRELYGRLFKRVRNGDADYPPIAQRRFKENEIADLPRKDYHLYPATMPETQADAYELARRHLADGARGAALKMLHHIRAVSLHPEAPGSTQGDVDIDSYFARSARFEAARNILRRIHEHGQRALIFTEDRRMQAFTAQWIRSEFGLDKVRIINGATTIARRKQYVTEFQRHIEIDDGFNVMILSPRAAGVGLTLTAATHVIHLSRWWNPAVEEQCNDRIYRIGQTKDVAVHLPLAIHPTYREGSFDCVLNDLMRRKTSLARAALWPPTDNDFDNGMLVTGVSGAAPFDPVVVDHLDWSGFEDWIVDRARESNDWEVSKTPRSGDAGADALLRHRRRRSTTAVVQVKHTTDPERLIDKTAVLDVLRADGRYGVTDPQRVVVTNARGFATRARDLALEKDVKLVDRDRLGLWPSHVIG